MGFPFDKSRLFKSLPVD